MNLIFLISYYKFYQSNYLFNYDFFVIIYLYYYRIIFLQIVRNFCIFMFSYLKYYYYFHYHMIYFRLIDEIIIEYKFINPNLIQYLMSINLL
jgi:hypothetical protein